MGEISDFIQLVSNQKVADILNAKEKLAIIAEIKSGVLIFIFRLKT